ncbi:MAG: hypothetical protein SCM57_14060, partial [Bacillota bacterium]|nr:hypothetical protein [Bacillota bacterium]
MSRKSRLPKSLLFTLLISFTVMIIVYAGSGISFSWHSPSADSVTRQSRPSVSVKASVTEGTITADDVKMNFNGSMVTPSLSASSNVYTISYTPPAKLANGLYTVTVDVYDDVLGSYESTNWKFTVDAFPNPSNWYPAKDSTISTTSPTISMRVKDTYDELDDTTVKAKLNGNAVPASFWYNESWGVIDKKAGTISVGTANLANGTHTIELFIADKAGNMLHETWSFTVAVPPEFTNLSPADKSETAGVSKVSAIVENGPVDWGSLKMTVNGSTVVPDVNQDTGLITYNHNFTTGSYQAYLEAKDILGNLGSASWSFISDTTPPDLVSVSGIEDGVTITDGKLSVKFKVTDFLDIKDNAVLALDGAALPAEFRYEGHTDYYGNYIVTSKKEAYIKYSGMVANGSHTLSLYTEDKLGNSRTTSWGLTVATAPVISDEKPVTYGVKTFTPTISAVVTIPGSTMDPSLITLKV